MPFYPAAAVSPNIGRIRSVRPNVIGEIMEGQSEGEWEEIGDQLEGRPIKGQKMIYQPSKVDWDDHMRSHVPFRRWCPFCVKGKCKSAAHLRTDKSEEEIEQQLRKTDRI